MILTRGTLQVAQRNSGAGSMNPARGNEYEAVHVAGLLTHWTHREPRGLRAIVSAPPHFAHGPTKCWASMAPVSVFRTPSEFAASSSYASRSICRESSSTSDFGFFDS